MSSYRLIEEESDRQPGASESLCTRLAVSCEPVLEVGAEGGGSWAQSAGYVVSPQKFSGRSSRAASRQVERSDSRGRQFTTLAVVSRPSLLWKCSSTPASSFTGERSEHPCALTTMVSHTSEKRVPGSRLVTSTGRLTGTLELRRRGAGEFAFCIFSHCLIATSPGRLAPPCNKIPLTALRAFISGVLCGFAERTRADTDFGNRGGLRPFLQ